MVINERTGTVVSGGDVRISHVTVSHGDLKRVHRHRQLGLAADLVSQTGAGVRSLTVSNTRISVDESRNEAEPAGQEHGGRPGAALAR